MMAKMKQELLEKGFIEIETPGQMECMAKITDPDTGEVAYHYLHKGRSVQDIPQFSTIDEVGRLNSIVNALTKQG